MDRRGFLHTSLRVGGYGLAAAALGLSGGLAYIQPRRHRLPPLLDGSATRPERAGTRKRVVVVGGGVSGLVAAIELAQRNFAVTLVERAPDLGGRLGGWTIRALGEEFPVEHGFHGFFSQYYNLGEVLTRAGATSELVESPGYPVLFGDRPPETFGRTTKIFPLNLLSVVRQSKSLHLMDFRHDGTGLRELLRFDGARTFAEFDHVDFATFAKEGAINSPMVQTVLEPFGKTTLNRLDKLSAAEAIRFFHFYFMGNPEGLAFRFTQRDSMTAVIRPLRRLLESLGGVVRTGVGARRLVRAGDRVAQVVVDADPVPIPAARLSRADVPARGFAVLPTESGASIFVARRGAGFLALDGRCTHMGCPVALDPQGSTFRCPCHAGEFDADGRPTAGPPKRPLAPLLVRQEGAALLIGGGSASAGEEPLACDYCVVACEVRGVRRLLGSSDHGAPALARSIESLGEADPYVVLRLWLDRPTAPQRSPFYTTARFRYTDSLAIYSRFQEPYVSWARRTGGSVVEIHAYAIAPADLAPPAAIRAQMLRELFAMLPELVGAKVLHEEFQQQSNFTRFAPGDAALRPRTVTPIENLFLAGDLVRLDFPAALMEAAAVSGRLAANHILAGEGLREVPISTVAPSGPLA